VISHADRSRSSIAAVARGKIAGEQPVDRIAQDHHDSRVRQARANGGRRVQRRQIRDARFPDGGLAACVLEQLLVVVPVEHQAGGRRDRRDFGREEAWFLDRTDEHVRMLAETVVERRRAGFGRADQEEIRNSRITSPPSP
jgi:hypothetical protein